LLFGGGLTLGMLIDKSGLGLLLVSEVAQLVNIVPMFLFLWIIDQNGLKEVLYFAMEN
jgi:sodium-dependent dicarboxylate transporter 2/3/5